MQLVNPLIEEGYITLNEYAAINEISSADALIRASTEWLTTDIVKERFGVIYISPLKIAEWEKCLEDPNTINPSPEHLISKYLDAVYISNGWVQPAPLVGDQLVYVVRCTQFIKIGVAKDPGARMKDMQVGSPYPLQIFAMYAVKKPTPAQSVECLLHRALHEYHERGEWFREGALDFFKSSHTLPTGKEK